MRGVLLGVIWLILFPFSAGASHAAEHGVVILQYHHIGDDTPRVTSVTAAELEEHFQFLEDNDFTVVSLTEAQRLLESPDPMPNKAVAITFDDGWRNVYDNGIHIFKEFEFPFTIFINPKLMEETPHLYMSWEQLTELQSYGATIANHSNSHGHMTWRQQGESEQQWLARQRRDVVEAQQMLQKALPGEQPRQFAYPYGEFNPQLEAMLAEEGYIAFGQHSGPWGPATPTTQIPRFPASAQYADLKTLRTKLLSLPLPAVTTAPRNMVLEDGSKKLEVKVDVASSNDFDTSLLNCFYQGEQLKPQWRKLEHQLGDGWQLTLHLKNPPLGRSRVNCTVPSRSQQGRFYWHSVPLVRPDAEGRWPD
ncbi:polysaccharide deacetylase family protein [Pseudidiomarina terrestris]|uniref:polysaccharide deacetylase family protein n=1 Tax=Pseudidiomarina terrestris TaxID=2820060 RepID=UPI00264D4519|nr:polysaccharide deacetylase family protein [Pseudidiomarina sp. 1ASP75-5]MDN7134205.1 polysaccharide deacetylase family protein [Pseudidiomarina sp. 1ASP75-5]